MAGGGEYRHGLTFLQPWGVFNDSAPFLGENNFELFIAYLPKFKTYA